MNTKTLACMAFALTCMAAQADTVFIAANKAGGTMNLTDNTSSDCPKGYMVYFGTGKDVNDDITRGCWRIINDSAHLMFQGGGERMIPMNNFDLTAYGDANYGSGGKKTRGSSL
ncbi:MAG: hypothetical protein JSS14_23265 [Proteobacteria bacterium]|nr:hypothetical protein [Pseudomonadota bacterium]